MQTTKKKKPIKNAEISKAEFKLAKLARNAAQMSRSETSTPKKKAPAKRDERFFDPGKNKSWL